MDVAAFGLGVTLALAASHPRTLPLVGKLFRTYRSGSVESRASVAGRALVGLGGAALIVMSFTVLSPRAPKPSFENTTPQQLAVTDTANVEWEGGQVLTAIMQHTPAGKSPRTVPLSDAQSWLPDLSSLDYSLVPYPGYASSGMFYIGTPFFSFAKKVCVSVPDQIISTVQIEAGKYVGTGAFCNQ